MSRDLVPRPLGVLALAVLLGAGCGTPEATDPLPSTTGGPRLTSEPTSTPTGAPTPRPSSTPFAVVAPPGDFYAVPEPLPAGPPGEVIWAERLAAPDGAVAWRVLYHSETIAGDPIAVSGIVAGPDTEPPDGGFPVIGYAHGTTGLADTCAPSRSARSAANPGAAVPLPVPALWQLGYVVAATDYEGLGTPGRHPYLVGGSEARSVLDSVRAARRLPGIHAGNDTVVLGASQGGHAALFSGEVGPSYAPDVPLAGVVALAPGAELAQAALLLGGDPTAVGYAVAIAAGFEAAYPEARLDRILSPKAVRALSVVDEACMGEVLSALAGPVEEMVRLDRLLEPPWPALLDENSPGRGRSGAPIFVGQGTADPLVVPDLTDALVARLCLNGERVTYRRYLGVGHGTVAEAAMDDVLRWVDDRLAGHDAPTDC